MTHSEQPDSRRESTAINPSARGRVTLWCHAQQVVLNVAADEYGVQVSLTPEQAEQLAGELRRFAARCRS